MVERKKVSAHPPLASIKNKEMDFINEGIITLSDKEAHPWEKDGIRNDVIKTFNIRLNEPSFLKLKYLSKQAKQSVNSICVSLIRKFLEDELK
jgi:hypothetical protein